MGACEARATKQGPVGHAPHLPQDRGDDRVIRRRVVRVVQECTGGRARDTHLGEPGAIAVAQFGRRLVDHHLADLRGGLAVGHGHAGAAGNGHEGAADGEISERRHACHVVEQARQRFEIRIGVDAQLGRDLALGRTHAQHAVGDVVATFADIRRAGSDPAEKCADTGHALLDRAERIAHQSDREIHRPHRRLGDRVAVGLRLVHMLERDDGAQFAQTKLEHVPALDPVLDAVRRQREQIKEPVAANQLGNLVVHTSDLVTQDRRRRRCREPLDLCGQRRSALPRTNGQSRRHSAPAKPRKVFFHRSCDLSTLRRNDGNSRIGVTADSRRDRCATLTCGSAERSAAARAAAGEITKVSHTFQPSGRCSAPNSL